MGCCVHISPEMEGLGKELKAGFSICISPRDIAHPTLPRPEISIPELLSSYSKLSLSDPSVWLREGLVWEMRWSIEQCGKHRHQCVQCGKSVNALMGAALSPRLANRSPGSFPRIHTSYICHVCSCILVSQTKSYSFPQSLKQQFLGHKKFSHRPWSDPHTAAGLVSGSWRVAAWWNLALAAALVVKAVILALLETRQSSAGFPTRLL